MIICKECGKECSAENALSYHLRSHNMSYTDYIIKHEFNGVWPLCLQCNKPLVRRNGGFSRFCSRKCASMGENNSMYGLTGEKSPNHGKVRTDVHKQRYSLAAKQRWCDHGDKFREFMKTQEYKQAQRNAQIRSNLQNPERSQKRSRSVHAFWSSDSALTIQRRREASDRALALLNENKIGPQAPFKQTWINNPFTGKLEYMHSSWETKFMLKCINENFPVTKAHNIVIDYKQEDGSTHRYVPDFKAIEKNIIFEVKGMMIKNDELKLAAARDQGYKVVLVDRSTFIKDQCIADLFAV